MTPTCACPPRVSPVCQAIPKLDLVIVGVTGMSAPLLMLIQRICIAAQGDSVPDTGNSITSHTANGSTNDKVTEHDSGGVDRDWPDGSRLGTGKRECGQVHVCVGPAGTRILRGWACGEFSPDRATLVVQEVDLVDDQQSHFLQT